MKNVKNKILWSQSSAVILVAYSMKQSRHVAFFQEIGNMTIIFQGILEFSAEFGQFLRMTMRNDFAELAFQTSIVWKSQSKHQQNLKIQKANLASIKCFHRIPPKQRQALFIAIFNSNPSISDRLPHFMYRVHHSTIFQHFLLLLRKFTSSL